MSVFIQNSNTFFWDRKENVGQSGICLNELFLLFKIKQFQDLKEISSTFQDYEKSQDKVKTILKSFTEFPINLETVDVWDLVPHWISEVYSEFKEQVLIEGLEYCKCKTKDFDKIINYFNNRFYGKVLEKLEFDILTLNGKEQISLAFAENFRFKSNPDMLNLFSLKKEERNLIIPQNKDSVIFAADFRQFEFRTFLKLQGFDDYLNNENIYEDLGKSLNLQAQDLKIGIISYLYGNKNNEKFEKFFKKQELLNKIEQNIFWWKDYPVFVPENDGDGKKIHSIVQTVSQFIYLEKLDKILNLIQNSNSKFIFPLHDSVILSLHKKDEELIDKIIDAMEDETYKVKCYIGSNFKDIMEI